MIEEAITKFEQALGIDGRRHDALWCLGNAYTSQGFLSGDAPSGACVQGGGRVGGWGMDAVELTRMGAWREGWGRQGVAAVNALCRAALLCCVDSPSCCIALLHCSPLHCCTAALLHCSQRVFRACGRLLPQGDGAGAGQRVLPPCARHVLQGAAGGRRLRLRRGAAGGRCKRWLC